MYEDILYDVQDPVATLTLNRPEKLNALRDRTSRELMHALAGAEQDPRVVGIVLTGAGRGFCGGLDMQALATIQEAGEIASYREADDVPAAEPGAPVGANFRLGYGYIMSIRKPVVVAVNGACAGLGFSLAMFCDLRFASESAFFHPAIRHSQRQGGTADHPAADRGRDGRPVGNLRCAHRVRLPQSRHHPALLRHRHALQRAAPPHRGRLRLGRAAGSTSATARGASSASCPSARDRRRPSGPTWTSSAGGMWGRSSSPWTARSSRAGP